MKAFGEGIIGVTEAYSPRLLALTPEEVQYKPSPRKWSKKEILGHLTDSAQVNLQRMIRGQIEDSPKIIYDQDEWVRVQRYQTCPMSGIINLWITLNRHLAHTIQAMDEQNYNRTCDTGKQTVELRTLDFLAEDYLVHMKHHLNQIFSVPVTGTK
jgi:hypothetical protein